MGGRSGLESEWGLLAGAQVLQRQPSLPDGKLELPAISAAASAAYATADTSMASYNAPRYSSNGSSSSSNGNGNGNGASPSKSSKSSMAGRAVKVELQVGPET